MSQKLEADRQYPAGALGFMDQHGLRGNILCDYEWAGYVLFHCAPRSHVFIDGRYEMIYPEQIAQDFMDFYDANPSASRVLASYPHDFVLISPKAPARKVVDESKEWILVYRDDACVLYARKNSPAAKIEGIPIAGKAPQFSFP